MRVCSLLPGATEIAFALGLGDEIVGVTHECDYPPEARTKPVVVNTVIDETATSKQIDQEVRERSKARVALYRIDQARLQEARPDVVLTQAMCAVCALDYNEVAAACQSLPSTPRLVALNANTLSDIFADIQLVGKATSRTTEAAALVAGLQQKIEALKARTSSCRLRPRVACLEWLDPLFSAGHWVPEMVEAAGGSSGLARKGEVSARIRWQEVLEFNPDVLVLMPCGFDVNRVRRESVHLSELPHWAELSAVTTGRVFAVNGHAYFNRAGPRLVDGLEILARIIHPEVFPWNLAPDAAEKLV
jgi:iron complex transport system substrate-binding protein